MIQYKKALEAILQSASQRTVEIEEVSIENSLGRFLARPVLSPEAVPPFNNSAMDGFAIRTFLTAGASDFHPVTFQIQGFIAAGDTPVGDSELHSQNAAWEIMTGAPMPSGDFDAVVKIEDVEVARDSSGKPVEIRLYRSVNSGENIRERGADFAEGSRVAAPGVQIQPEHIMALASLGIERLSVMKRPKVALISTGRELVHYSEKTLTPGMIRNSTSPYLTAALPKFGAECKYFGSIPDDPEKFIELLTQVISTQPDLILTTGAVSMGKHDFVSDCLERMGAKPIFHKVAIAPGKPLLFSEIETHGPVFFGLPGNPISTSVGIRFFVAPYLRALMGLPPEKPYRARLAAATHKPNALRCFFKARSEYTADGVKVRSLPGQASFLVSPLLKSNSWVVLEESGPKVEKDAEVDVYPLFPDPYEESAVSLDGVSFQDKKGCC